MPFAGRQSLLNRVKTGGDSENHIWMILLRTQLLLNTASTKLSNSMLSFDLISTKMPFGGTKMPFGGRQKPIE